MTVQPTCRAATLAALLAACALPAAAQQADGLDCVIEPRSVVDLTASVEGAIAGILVSRGDAVRAGDPVVQLDDAIERLEVELAAMRAGSDVELRSQQERLALRRQELERAQSLNAKNIGAGRDVDEAAIEVALTELAIEKARTDLALARIEHAQAAARLDRRLLRSPVDGVVMAVESAPGEFAHEQMTILRIAETDPLHVEVFAPAELFGRIAVGQGYSVVPMAPIGASRTATVSVVDPVFDAASGTFGVRLELPNADGAIPAGIRCRLLVEAS